MRKILLLLTTLLLICLSRAAAQEVSLILPADGTLDCNQEVTIPVTVANYANINTLRFQVEWDALDFELVTFNNLANIILVRDPAATPTYVSAGVLSTPSDLSDGDSLFTLTLRAITEDAAASNVFISDTITFGGTFINEDPIEIVRDTTTYTFGTTCAPVPDPTISCPTSRNITIEQGASSVAVDNLTPTINDDNGMMEVRYNLVFDNSNTVNGTSDASGEIFNVGVTTLTYFLINTNGDTTDQCSVDITVVEEEGVADATILIATTAGDCSGNVVCVDVNMGAIQDITDMQFAIQWDPVLMTLDSTNVAASIQTGNASALLGTSQAADGIVTFSFVDLSLNGMDFTTSDNLFTLCFLPRTNGTATLQFTDNGLAEGGSIQVNQSTGNGEFTDITNQITFTDGSVAISNCSDANTGFEITSSSIDCDTDNQTCVAVQIGALNDLANIQFSINWDASLLDFVSIQNVNASISQDILDFGTLSTNSGILNFSWADLGNGQSFTNDEILFEVCYNGLADGNPTLNFSDNETTIVVNQYDINQDQTEISGDLTFSSGAIVVSNCTDSIPSTGSFTVNSTTSNCEANVQACVDVMANALSNLANVQFAINWNPTILRFTSVTNNDAILNSNSTNYGTVRTAEGILNFSWFDLGGDGQNFNTDEVLFTICFDPLRNGTTDLTFVNNETPVVVNQYDADFNQIDITNDITLTDGSIAVSNCTDITPENGIVVEGAMIDCNVTGQETCLDVNISALANLANIQFSVNWDTSILQFASVNNNDVLLNPVATNYGIERTSQGILNFSWFDLNDTGQDFAANDRLFTLCFLPTGQGDANVAITDNETTIRINQFDDNENQIDITADLDFNANAVLVIDTIAPTVTNCPTAEVVLYTTADDCQVTGQWQEPIFTDACNSVSVQQTDTLGNLFGIGNRVIQYTGVDGAGNIATCTFILSVRDTITPTVVNCPQNQVINVSVATDCDNTATWIPPTAMDACSANPIISTNFQPGDAFPRGVNTVRYSVLDSSGNIDTSCTFTVEITGEEPVRLSNCPDNIVETFSPETGCDITIEWTEPILVEGCTEGEIIVLSNFAPGDAFPVGVTTVTYIAADEGGNQDSCSFEVTLSGSNPITFPNCPGNINLNSLTNQCGANAGWSIPTTSGGCGIVNLVSNFEPGDFFPVGNTTVTYTATDQAGQTSVCNFIVTVTDEQPLVVICPQDIIVDANGAIQSDPANFISSATLENCGEIRMEYNDIEAFDNCNLAITRTLTQGLLSNSLFFDTTQMSFVVSNASQESVTCDFRIIVNEPTPVVASLSSSLVCTGQPLTLQASTIPDAIYSWSGPNGFLSNEQNPIINAPDSLNAGTYAVAAATPGGCSVTSTINVAINEGITISASANDLDCTGGTITLMAEGEGVESWSWIGPNSYTSTEQSPVINNALALQAGTYTVVGTAANGCTAQQEVEVTIATITPTVAANGLLETGEACEGQSFDLKGNVFPGDPIYNWTASNSGGGLPDDVNDSLITVTPTSVGEFTYTYTVDLGNGCMADTSITITVLPSPNFTTVSNAPIICATQDSQLMLSGVTDDLSIDWNWTGPNDFTSPFQNALIREVDASLSGDYILTGTSENGCSDMDTVSVVITDRPALPSFSNFRTNVCEGDSIRLAPDSLISGISYFWTGPNGFTSNDSIVVIPNALPENGGGYQLIQSIDGCDSDPGTVLVNILSDPLTRDDLVENLFGNVANFVVTENDSIAPGAGFDISIMSNGQSVDRIENEAGTIVLNEDNTFTFTPVTDWIGSVQFAYELCYEDCPELCSMAIVTINTDVSSDSCFIPTVLSPNGDDKNDALIISCNDSVSKGGGIRIFNQWGGEVYAAFPYNNNDPWRGTYNGEDLPDGTYYYIYMEFDDSEPIKGFVTIFR